MNNIATENMLNVLMYLFKNHMENNCRLKGNPRKLTVELELLGFERATINKAFNWIADLTVLQVNLKQRPPHRHSVRIFSREEHKKIDKDSQGFIISLQELGILSSSVRELVIAQIMQLDGEKIGVSQVKWVTLMVLFNQPDQRDSLLCMEHLVLHENQETMQ